MQLCMAHLLVVSNVQYLSNSASGFEYTVIFGLKKMFLRNCFLSFEDINNRRPPKDAACKAAYFTHQVLNCWINIGGLNWAVR
jgi:hypothetical protein